MNQPSEGWERPRGRHGALTFRSVVRGVAGPMLAISILWMSTVIWPTGLTATWIYVPPLQATAFLAAISAVFAIGLFRSTERACVFAVLVAVAIFMVPRVTLPILPDTTQTTLRVFALNTYFGRADDEAIVRIIKELNPHIVILEETTTQEATTVATGTGLRVTGAIRPGASGAEGVAILVREGVDSTGRHYSDAEELGLAKFQMPMVTGVSQAQATGDEAGESSQREGSSLSIVGVHLLTPIGDDRLQWDHQLEALGTWVHNQPSSRGIIMAGDFNATRSHPRLRAVGLKDCTGHLAHTPTWPADFPVLRLDHVMTSGTCHDAGQVKVSGTDHRGVWADITL